MDKPTDTPQGRPRGKLDWKTSSFSFANGNCVQVASLLEGGIGIRDSKDPRGAILRFTPDEWDALLGGVDNGEFDEFG